MGGCERRRLEKLLVTGDNPVPARRWYQNSLKRSSAQLLVLVGTVTFGAAGVRAAGNEAAFANLQHSMHQSTAKPLGQAAQREPQ